MASLFDNLSEIIGEEDIKKKLEEKKELNIYWGTAPTGDPHFAYFVPLIKVRDAVRDGHNVTILIADVHSYMDEGIQSVSRAQERAAYYKFIVSAMLDVLGVKEDEYTMVFGSDYQFDKAYCRDLLKFSSLLGTREAIRAGSDVVKENDNPRLSNLLYPLMQVLDEAYLNADVEIGGVDQRKIFMLSRDFVSKLEYEKCGYLITPLVPSLSYGKVLQNAMKEEQKKKQKKEKLDNLPDLSEDEKAKVVQNLKRKMKMSASDPASKISFQDSNESIQKKISKAFCVDKDPDITSNGILSILKYIIFPIYGAYDVLRDDKWGGNLHYKTYEEFNQDWVQGKLSSADIKLSISKYIMELIEPVRKKILSNIELYNQAYLVRQIK